MKLKKTILIGLSVVVLFVCTTLWSAPLTDSTEMKEQLERIAHEVPNGTLSIEAATETLKNITEKTPELAETQLFKTALLACYYMVLSEDKLECYKELSKGELQEPLFCVIDDNFDKYNSLGNKDLKSLLLKDFRIPDGYDCFNDCFFSAYEYWTYSVVAWILKRRTNAGDITAKEALGAAIAILEKTLHRLDPERMVKVVKKILPIVDEDAPFLETPLFQRALKIACPDI